MQFKGYGIARNQLFIGFIIGIEANGYSIKKIFSIIEIVRLYIIIDQGLG